MTLVELHNTHIGIFGEYPHPNPPPTTKNPTQDFGQSAVCVKYIILLPHTSVGDMLFQYYEAILQEHMPRLNKDLTT